MSLTELAFGGLAAAALATAPASLLAFRRSDPLLPARAAGWAAAIVTAYYAAQSAQEPLLRMLVPTAVLLWASVFWRSVRVAKPIGWLRATGAAFIYACPALVVLGSEPFGLIVTTDFVAGALFIVGLGLSLTWPPLALGLMLVAFWTLALREPAGFLTVFAPLLAWGEGVVSFERQVARKDGVPRWETPVIFGSDKQ